MHFSDPKTFIVDLPFQRNLLRISRRNQAASHQNRKLVQIPKEKTPWSVRQHKISSFYLFFSFIIITLEILKKRRILKPEEEHILEEHFRESQNPNYETLKEL